MKKISFIISVLVLACVAVFAVSCNNATSGDDKKADTAKTKATAEAGSIVYFNLDRILQEYDMANDLRSVVETKVNSINQEVTRRGNKLQKDINAFQDKINKGLLTQTVAQSQSQQLTEQQNSFQTYANQKQQEIADEQQVMMNQIADAVKKYVDQFNAEKKFAMIIATQGDVLPAPVVTADSTLDITDEILEGLNASYVKEKAETKAQ